MRNVMRIGMNSGRAAAAAAVIGAGLATIETIGIGAPVYPGFSDCRFHDSAGEERCAEECLPGQKCCTMPHYTAQGSWVNLAAACCPIGDDNCWARWTEEDSIVYVWCGTIADNPGGPPG